MGFWVDFVSHQLGVTPSLGDLQRSSPAMPGVLMTTATPKPAMLRSTRRRSMGTSRPAETKRVLAPSIGTFSAGLEASGARHRSTPGGDPQPP